jgi:hypothetical protein
VQEKSKGTKKRKSDKRQRREKVMKKEVLGEIEGGKNEGSEIIEKLKC